MKDMINSYQFFLNKKNKKGKEEKKIIYNLGFENLSIIDMAKKIKKTLGTDPKIKIKSSNDTRSYRQNSEKILKEGYKKISNLDEIIDLKEKYETKKIYKRKNFFRINTLKMIKIS